jgi:hypothetical protein
VIRRRSLCVLVWLLLATASRAATLSAENLTETIYVVLRGWHIDLGFPVPETSFATGGRGRGRMNLCGGSYNSRESWEAPGGRNKCVTNSWRACASLKPSLRRANSNRVRSSPA